MYAIMVRRFVIRFFFSISKYKFASFFFRTIIPISFSVLFLLFPYFTAKLFCFFRIWLLECPRAFSTYLFVEFSFIILVYPFLFVVLEPASVSFFH